VQQIGAKTRSPERLLSDFGTFLPWLVQKIHTLTDN
jgi:hypothetical protein